MANIERMSSLASILMIVPIVGGCAQSLALQQPGPLHCREQVFEATTIRPDVIACLGAPTRTIGTPDSVRLTDDYSYEDGRSRNSTTSKVARTFLYTLGDVATLFITQLVFVPAEALILDSARFRATVQYEKDDAGHWRVVEATESERR